MTYNAIHCDLEVKVNSILMKFLEDKVRRYSQNMKNGKEFDGVLLPPKRKILCAGARMIYIQYTLVYFTQNFKQNIYF